MNFSFVITVIIFFICITIFVAWKPPKNGFLKRFILILENFILIFVAVLLALLQSEYEKNNEIRNTVSGNLEGVMLEAKIAYNDSSSIELKQHTGYSKVTRKVTSLDIQQSKMFGGQENTPPELGTEYTASYPIYKHCMNVKEVTEECKRMTLSSIPEEFIFVEAILKSDNSINIINSNAYLNIAKHYKNIKSISKVLHEKIINKEYEQSQFNSLAFLAKKYDKEVLNLYRIACVLKHSINDGEEVFTIDNLHNIRGEPPFYFDGKNYSNWLKSKEGCFNINKPLSKNSFDNLYIPYLPK